MKKITTEGFICLEDDYNFLYKIAKIEYEEWEDGNYSYTFHPFYNVIDMLPVNLFQGIPGLDLDLRKRVYVRKNMVPVFIEERSPGLNRENLWELLDAVGMNSLNRLEWLKRTDTRYCGDRLFVIPFEGNEIKTYKTNSMYDLVKRSDNINKKLLDIICSGDYLYADDITIDDTNRNYYYKLLMQFYIHDYNRKKSCINKGIAQAKENNVYKGRKRINVNPYQFDDVARDYINGKISSEKAASLLNISRSTFYRRLAEYKKQN